MEKLCGVFLLLKTANQQMPLLGRQNKKFTFKMSTTGLLRRLAFLYFWQINQMSQICHKKRENKSYVGRRFNKINGDFL